VLVVDDHAVFRSAARAELEAGGLEVVGELDRARPAVDAARALRPDVVLVDIRLPDGDGVALAERIMLAVPDSAVVLTSSMNDDDARERLTAADSAAAYVHKRRLTAATLRSMVGN
jgi:DNA-binding NarL/FixJ family response regulator